MLTLIGFFLTIGDDYFSQFDYDVNRITKDLLHHQDNLNYSEVRVHHKVKNPQYYFALDVSKSILNNKVHRPIPLTEHIKNTIKDINISGKCPRDGWNFDIEEGDRTIDFWRLLQVRLINTIIKQSNKHPNDFNYSVVFFAESPEEITDSTKTVNEVLNRIYTEDFHGNYTDFEALLGCLHDEIIRKNVSYADHYEPVECHIILFSDYLHDVGSKYVENDIEKKMLDFMLEMRGKSVNVKFYYLEGTGKYNGIPVDYMLRTVFPESPIGLVDEEDELICPIISKKPISFFYTNSLFEESLTTHITFDGINKKRELCFGLGSNSDDVERLEEVKQEYYLIDGTDTVFLSNRNRKKIIVDLNDKVELMIKGYIPSPYKSPDIIIQDDEDGTRYIIPVSFYMGFPTACRLLLYCIIIVLGLLFFLLVVNLIKELD